MDRNESKEHIPVLVDRVVDQLAMVPDGAYLDLTAGAGGHLEALSKKLDSTARLYGIDRDRDAVNLAGMNLKGCKQLRKIVQASFADIDRVIDEFEDKYFDGALLDLGLSSLQIDRPERGFSFQQDGPLDMRFDQQAPIKTAADLLNSLDSGMLSDIFHRYGEERLANRLASEIVRERQKGMIDTTANLVRIVNRVSRPPHQKKTLSRIFQALRIAVNGELDALESVLPKVVDLLNKKGRIVVLAYHSLEDRMVKRFIQRESRDCICPPKLPQCLCDHRASLKMIGRRPEKPTSEEIGFNPRARSARLRVAEKI